jgi:hypothetical protein
MMWGSVDRTTADRDSIEPTLRIFTVVRYDHLSELPISFSARLKLQGGRFIGGASVGTFSGSNIRVSVLWMPNPGTPPPHGDGEMRVEFSFRLTPLEVSAIHLQRGADAHADIQLTLSIQAQAVELKLRPFTIEFVEGVPRSGGAPRPNLIALHPPTAPGNPGDVLVAKGDDVPFRLMTHALGDLGVMIPSSHWVRDYAPAFGVGRFMTVDIPEPETAPSGAGELATRVNQAVDALRRMQEDVRKSEWTQCAEDARPVLELLNRQELLRPLLRTAGVPEANETALLEGLRQVFTYTHAFHHRVQDGGRVTESAVNAEPEDALLAFGVTAALLNLVAKKLSRTTAAQI